MVILDFLLFLIIGVCIVYCWVLNKRIQDLQNSRVEFARMIKELNLAIIKAQTSISELNELSNNVGNDLKANIQTAKDFITKLTSLSNTALTLISKLKKHKVTFASEQNSNLTPSAAENEAKIDNLEHEQLIKSSSRFKDEDLANEKLLDKDKVNYKDHLKTFLTKIVTKDTENNVNLNQISYYNTLRKIKPKK